MYEHEDNVKYNNYYVNESVGIACGMTWETFITKRIIEPLQMDNTFAGLDYVKDRSNLAIPHDTNTRRSL